MMFVSQDAAAVAMQEIEIISMDDGEGNVTTTMLPNHPSASDSQDDHEQAMETLFAMMGNEQLLPTIDYHAQSRMKATPISITGINSSAAAGVIMDDDLVNDHDRTKMCDWYYEMSEFLKIDRATASRSLTLLDRFMAIPIHQIAGSASLNSLGDGYNIAGVVVAASQNRDEYQLVALTALFLAIKLFERLNIQPEHVSYLSRGRYTSDEVIKMEMIMLAALEWKVCTADKADYVDAFLNVMFPNKINHQINSSSCCWEEDKAVGCSRTTGSSNSNDDLLLSGLKDLANLQIQLSDFESSFSTQSQSLVAFAAVINAFEMKKDKISNLDQHMFLESVQHLMRKMYPLNASGKKQREELARTVDRLRVLIDPPASSHGMRSTPSVDLTPTSHQKYQHPSYNTCTDDHSNTDTQDVEVSPLDVALESMENFDMAQLLCCGNGGTHTDHVSDGKDDHDMMVTDAVANANNGLLESDAPFSLAENNGKTANKKQDCRHHAVRNHSPTSIDTILFGAGMK